nr:MAG TPA: hypothetical protein [Caudoviricetes sp.]
MKIYASFCELNISFYKTLTFRFADYIYSTFANRVIRKVLSKKSINSLTFFVNSATNRYFFLYYGCFFIFYT